MTRVRTIAPGEYYHVYNRGAFRTTIFQNDADRKRFLFYLLYFQSPHPVSHPSRIIANFDTFSGFPAQEEMTQVIIQKRTVGLTGFCLMPNHFHLLLRENVAGGISAYMQRISIAYTHFMKEKYGISGHVFEGRYKSVHVKDNHQLLYLSAYIHRNPRELTAWKGKEFEYPWSSLQDYTQANRWGGLLEADIIADQFEGAVNSNYADFVKMSGAKEFESEIPELVSGL